jgi:hypothetical protein
MRAVNSKSAGSVQREQQRMEGSVDGKWRRVMLMSAATSAWLVYDSATATEAPSQAVAIFQFGLLACSLVGLAGSLLMYA